MCYWTTHIFEWASAMTEDFPDWLRCYCGAMTLGEARAVARGGRA